MVSRSLWKVGELARATGLTVRTLHHYDQIGLLSPSRRSAAGYRLYDARDVARLQQIRSLRALGLTLEEIRACLDREDCSPPQVIARHLAHLQEQMRRQEELRQRLEGLARYLASREEPPAEALIKTLEVMSVVDKYYTPEQMEQIKARGRQIGEERIRQVEAEWPQLIAAVRAEMEKGTDPASPTVQALAKRWMALVSEFTGGDAGIAQSLQRMYQEEETVREQTGIDPRLMEYVGKLMAAGK